MASYLDSLVKKAKASKSTTPAASPAVRVTEGEKPSRGPKPSAAASPAVEAPASALASIAIVSPIPPAPSVAAPGALAFGAPQPRRQTPRGEDEEEPANRVLVESYGSAKIYRVPGEPLFWYDVPAIHYRGDEKALIDALVEIASKVITFEEPYATPEQKRDAFFKQLLEIIDATPELRVPPNAREFYARAVVQEMVGFGQLDPLLEDDHLEEIMVLGPNRPTYVFHRKYEMMRTNVVFYDDVDIRDLIDRIARDVGRRIDFASPLLDARLPDGTRVNATIPPASIDGSTLTIRKFRTDPFTVVDLMDLGTLNSEVAAFLWLATDGLGARPANILVSGGTASGKTSTLNMLCSFVPANERVITAEDVAELALPLPHWIRLETRPPGIEGSGEIDLNTLVKNILHMRPDRIIVGEIRAEEGFTLFSAMNTGHMGSMGTVHANSARETLIRLANPPISVPEIMLDSLNFIVMQQRVNDRRKGLIRRITEIAEIVPTESGIPSLQVLYNWDAATDTLTATGVPSAYLQTLSRFTGLSKELIQQEIDARRKVLEEMQHNGIRSIESVTEITQKYILRQKGRI